MSIPEDRKKSLYESIPVMDKTKAMKYILKGIIVVMLFGCIMLTSVSLANGSDEWAAVASQENKEAYWNGDYGYSEYIEKEQDIQRTEYWLDYQAFIVVNIARIGVYLGFLSVFIGLMGFATNDQIDQRTRWLSLIFAGVIIMAILFTLVINVSITIN